MYFFPFLLSLLLLISGLITLWLENVAVWQQSSKISWDIFYALV